MTTQRIGFLIWPSTRPLTLALAEEVLQVAQRVHPEVVYDLVFLQAEPAQEGSWRLPGEPWNGRLEGCHKLFLLADEQPPAVGAIVDRSRAALGATLVLPAPRSSTDDGMRRALVVARAPGAGPLPPGDIARLDALADETARAVSQASAAGDGSAEAVDDDLSPREREVLLLIADGLSNRQIAHALFLSEKTVKNYITGLLRKLGMQRRTQAAVYGATVRDAL